MDVEQYSKETVEAIVDRFYKTIGKGYDLKIHHPENIISGKALFAANHFHYYDPFFVGIAVMKHAKNMTHYIAKSDLFKIPILSNEIKKLQSIKIIRPYNQIKLDNGLIERKPIENLQKSNEAANRFKEIIKNDIPYYLDRDESICFALSGTRTKNYSLNEESKKNELLYLENGIIMKSGKAILSMVTPRDKDIYIVPTAVETYQKDSNNVLLKCLMAQLGLFRPKQKIGVDVSFGQPIHIKSFIEEHKKEYDDKGNKIHSLQYLAETIRDDIWNLRKELQLTNLDDYERNISKYFD